MFTKYQLSRAEDLLEGLRRMKAGDWFWVDWHDFEVMFFRIDNAFDLILQQPSRPYKQVFEDEFGHSLVIKEEDPFRLRLLIGHRHEFRTRTERVIDFPTEEVSLSPWNQNTPMTRSYTTRDILKQYVVDSVTGQEIHVGE